MARRQWRHAIHRSPAAARHTGQPHPDAAGRRSRAEGLQRIGANSGIRARRRQGQPSSQGGRPRAGSQTKEGRGAEGSRAQGRRGQAGQGAQRELRPSPQLRTLAAKRPAHRADQREGRARGPRRQRSLRRDAAHPRVDRQQLPLRRRSPGQAPPPCPLQSSSSAPGDLAFGERWMPLGSFSPCAR